jgi:hypothetical protein
MRRTGSLTVIILLFVAIATSMSLGGPRDGLWSQVRDAMNKGLPQTAVTLLDQIIPGALADQAWAEATKAVCLKIAQNGKIQGGKTEEMIVQLQAEIATAPDPMKPVMETILGHWYWGYLQNNRRGFLDRSQTSEPPGADITTWDLATILAEIDKHFTAALAAEPILKTTPINVWNDLIEKGTTPDTYRPTLYDFLVFDALELYSAGEQVGAVPQDAFEIMAGSPIFAPVAEFLAWQPQTSDTGSAKVKAIRLYQGLLSFHQKDADPTAFIHADLQRLTFGCNYAVGPEKTELYRAALERFTNQWKGNEIVAQALYQWAYFECGQGDYLKAHTLASQGWDRYPAGTGGIQCYNLVQRLEAKSAEVATERVWSDPLPDIQVTYCNVDRIYFRIVAVKFEEYAQIYWYEDLSQSQITALLAVQPVLQWSADLPRTTDYESRTQTLPAPKGLTKGFYFLIASHDPSFALPANQVSAASFWVSDLGIVLRTENNLSAFVEGYLVNAKSGEPIVGATVTCWKVTGYIDGQAHYEPGVQVQSDANGVFRFPAQAKLFGMIVAESAGDRVSSVEGNGIAAPYTPPAPGTGKPQLRTVLFTDRSLYRPGQTVHYKGICISLNTTDNDYHTVAGQSVTAEFRDTKYKTLAKQELTSNAYGSFSGSFTAPSSGLMGSMSVIAGGADVSFSVEEYRRPTFRVQLDAPVEAPKLGEQVVVPGQAIACTGTPIGGARVEWRVVRQVRFPSWCWWAGWTYFSDPQPIAHGSATTESGGSFTIPFTAQPDPVVAPADEPVFEFVASADVTDIAGETVSAQSTVRAGYTALQVAIVADSWQTPDKPIQLTVQTQSLDGTGEPASGTIRIHNLQQPNSPTRGALMEGYTNDYYWWQRAPGKPDASNPETWALATLVSEQAFQTDAAGQITVPITLPAGIYRATVATQDRFGTAVTARQTIQVVDLSADHLKVRVAHYLGAPRWSVEPGQTFTALWGTGYETGRAYIEIWCADRLVRAWWTDPNHTQEVIRQPVTESMCGGFILFVTHIHENRMYFDQRIVEVPWTNKQLTVAWEHFRSRLEPGQKETWTAVITGPDVKGAAAEMVATLYDASLDQYRPHDWIHSFPEGNFGGVRFRHEITWSFGHSFQNISITLPQLLSDWTIDSKSVTISYRHFCSDILSAAPMWGTSTVTRATRGGGSSGPAPLPAPATPTPSTKTTVPATPDLNRVSPYTDFDETAFFFPHLVPGADGAVRMEFTMPQAPTEWRFLGFAHDSQLRSGYLTDITVTAQDLVVEPKPPQFVRAGEAIEFTVKISNRSAARQTGKVSLTLADAGTLAARDEDLGNTAPQQTFDVPGKESRLYSWRLTIPDGCDRLIYKAVGTTMHLSDGEQGYLPVLSRRASDL